jgi:Uma2 family endonuclease
MSIEAPVIPPTLESGPAWEVARLFPDQGHWDEGDFLALNLLTNNLVELINGRVEVLETPTKSHQKRSARLGRAIEDFCERSGIEGEVVLAAYPVRVAAGRFREPGVVFAFDSASLGEDFAQKPDLVAEVVSKDRRRDLVEKRRDYAKAGIPEYWIIDPEKSRVVVLGLKGKQYVVAGEYSASDDARSRILKGFAIPARDLLK